MRRIFALALLLPAAAAALLLVTNTNDAKSRAKLAPAQLREDFKVFRSALEEGHAGLYRHTGKAEMDRIFDRAAQALDRPMDASELYRVLAPVIASGVKCGHTEVRLPDALRQEINDRTPLLPLRVRILDRKVYVHQDLANADHRLAGREILSINGVPASQIVATMLAAATGDGDIMTSRRNEIDGFRFSIGLASLLGLGSPYDVTLADRKTGTQEKVRLTGTNLPKLRNAADALKPAPDTDPSLEFRDGGKIAVMRIAEFSGGLAGFYQDSFEEMQEKKTAALIIDLRNNGGGMDHLGKLLFSYFIEEPFDYYSDVYMYKLSYDFDRYASGDSIMSSLFSRGKDGKYHAVNHPNWGRQHPSRPAFRGKVFVLMNGGSFSTTTEFLTHMHARKRATFIGEEAGGGYYGNTAGFMPSVRLPNSKLEVTVPLVAYYLAVPGGKPVSRGVPPDHPVQHTIEDVIAGKDKDMELALRLARQSNQAP